MAASINTSDTRLAELSVANTQPITSGLHLDDVVEKDCSNSAKLPKIISDLKEGRCALSERAARALERSILAIVVIAAMVLLSFPSALYSKIEVSVHSVK